MMTQRSKCLLCAVIGAWLTYVLACALYGERAQTRPAHAPNVKHILLWTPKKSFYDLIDDGFLAFIRNKCKRFDCLVTYDKQLFGNVTEFDAIVFGGVDLFGARISLPGQRTPRQKYVFAATESADNYPVCDAIYDNYFNWTWTYKLDSDLRWGYISIFDLKGRVVGPKTDMVWPRLRPIDDALKKKLSKKSKGAAWFVSNCKTKAKREDFYAELQEQLQELGFAWKIDVFGRCGTRSCPRSRAGDCYRLVEDSYHFYLSFENSFAEDYVTEKLLTALNNYAVPVVYGGANYSRFLPPGSYLDARKLGPRKLLEKMNEVMLDKEKYYDFFRWRNHFVYKETVQSTDICNLCTALHSERLMRPSRANDLRRWWNVKSWDGRDSTCDSL